MERQTLQQEAPVYHVCQACGGEGCEACSDLCIIEGDIKPSIQCPRCGKTDFDSPEGCQSPSVYSPSVGDWLCGMPGLSGAVSTRMSFRPVHFEWNRDYLMNCGIGGEK